MPGQRDTDDISRLAQESIEPIIRVIRGWFTDREYGPKAMLLLGRGVPESDPEKIISMSWGANAEPMFEELEIFLARRLAEFLAHDRQTPTETTAKILQCRVISKLKQAREREDYGVPAMAHLGKIFEDLKVKEDRMLENKHHYEEKEKSKKILGACIHVWGEERDRVLSNSLRITEALKKSIELGVESADNMLTAMEQGIQAGMSGQNDGISIAPDAQDGPSVISVDPVSTLTRRAPR
jgi:hypothetical protein